MCVSHTNIHIYTHRVPFSTLLWFLLPAVVLHTSVTCPSSASFSMFTPAHATIRDSCYISVITAPRCREVFAFHMGLLLPLYRPGAVSHRFLSGHAQDSAHWFRNENACIDSRSCFVKQKIQPGKKKPSDWENPTGFKSEFLLVNLHLEFLRVQQVTKQNNTAAQMNKHSTFKYNRMYTIIKFRSVNTQTCLLLYLILHHWL